MKNLLVNILDPVWNILNITKSKNPFNLSSIKDRIMQMNLFIILVMTMDMFTTTNMFLLQHALLKQ